MLNLAVLNTRGGEAGERLGQGLANAGFQVFNVPVLSIEGVDYPSPADNFCPDAVIFISANAVVFGVNLLSTLSQTKLFAIGKSTQTALADQGLQAAVANAGQDSEALLAHDFFQQVEGKIIAIVKGRGGRDYLADQLKQRGATVETFDVYQRTFPSNPDYKALAAWAAQPNKAALVYSGESLKNLQQLFENSNEVAYLTWPIVTIHPRITGIASQLGFTQVTTAGTSLENLVSCLETL